MALYKAPNPRQNITHAQALEALKMFEMIGVKPVKFGVFNPNGWRNEFTPVENVTAAEKLTEAHWVGFFKSTDDLGPDKPTWYSLADTYRELMFAKAANLDPKYLLQAFIDMHRELTGFGMTVEKAIVQRFSQELGYMLREELYGA